MKQNTTPTLLIKIKMPFENITRIEFIFKKEVSEYANTLLHKIYDSNIPVTEQNDADFVVGVELTAEETMRLCAGEVFMDTRIVLTGGYIPETSIAKINVNETLFRQVYQSD